ncbi:MAG TPA: hypothetical protein VLH85_08270 [Levilinea sp.]|nr:hypothetical protein [Levilinea sp.]
MRLHASYNLFIQVEYDFLTIDTGSTMFVVGDFGAGQALTGTTFWRLYNRPEQRMPVRAKAVG